MPVYDYGTHQPLGTRRVQPADVVIVEGTLVLHFRAVRELLSMKVFVDTDDDVRLARRCGAARVSLCARVLFCARLWARKRSRTCFGCQDAACRLQPVVMYAV